jgi:hypothetical protein
MSFIIREKWVWIIIGMCILVMVGPYLLMLVILQLPDVLRASLVWLIILGWGIAGGYKDWLTDAEKRKQKARAHRVEDEPSLSIQTEIK